jgi:hypothetical protein
MPALVIDGFDSYNGTGAAVGVQTNWTPASGVNLGGTTAGRFGGLAFAPHSSNGWRRSFAATTELTFSASFLFNGTGSANPGITFGNGTTPHVAVVFGTDGQVALRNSAAQLAVSPVGKIPHSTWVTIEIEIVVDDTAGRVTFYMEGEKIVEAVNVDTRNGLTTTIDRLSIGYGLNNTTGSGAHTWDDIVVTDSATKPANAVRVPTQYPDADGATLNLVPSTGTSHFAMVDETPASTTDYLQGSSVGELDEIGVGNMVKSPASILAVQASAYAAKTDATARSIALGVKSGGVVSEAAAYALVTTGGRTNHLLNADPATAAAWTEAGVNALELRPRIAA